MYMYYLSRNDMNVLILCILITEAVEASVVGRRQPPPRDHLGIFEGGKGRAFTETVAIESLLLHLGRGCNFSSSSLNNGSSSTTIILVTVSSSK